MPLDACVKQRLRALDHEPEIIIPQSKKESKLPFIRDGIRHHSGRPDGSILEVRGRVGGLDVVEREACPLEQARHRLSDRHRARLHRAVRLLLHQHAEAAAGQLRWGVRL